MEGNPELIEALDAWHDFYLLGGTAAATLVGLMFVSASIAAGLFTDRHRAGLQTFLTPTVLHFGAVLITSLLVMVPSQSWLSLGALLLAGGAVGLGYSVVTCIRMHRRGLAARIDVPDRIWYAALPVAGYVVMVAAAVALLREAELGLDLLALAQALLMLMGIRNAWDMTLWWMEQRTPNGGSP